MRGRSLRLVILLFTVLGPLTAFQNCAPSASFNHDDAAASSAQSSTVPAVMDIRGTISDALNSNPISGAVVKIRKASSPTTVVATVSTDGSGNYVTGVLPAGSYLVDISATGYITVTDIAAVVATNQETVVNKSLSTSLASGQLRIVLNWCSAKSAAVEDVDSYLALPDGNTIFFNNKTGTGAQLDIDVIHWQGPETITISTVNNGTYIYYVNNYSTRGNLAALGNSDVRVTVYKGSAVLKNYVVPVGSGITYELFRIVNGALVDTMGYTTALPYAQ